MRHNREQSLYEIQVRFVKRYADLLRIVNDTKMGLVRDNVLGHEQG